MSRLSVTLVEGGKKLEFDALPGDTAESFHSRLVDSVEKSGLALDVRLDGDRLAVYHALSGSQNSFQAYSSVDGVLSFADEVQKALPGQDVEASIGGIPVAGRGDLLVGNEGSSLEGLVLRYTGAAVGDVGRVKISNNALQFQLGPDADQIATVALPSIFPQNLGRGIPNQSNLRSLADVEVLSPQRSQDSIQVIDKTIDELSLLRGELGAFQRNNLERNADNLRITAENLTAAESIVRDTNYAEELAEFTKNRILYDTSASILAQASTTPRSVLDLLE